MTATDLQARGRLARKRGHAWNVEVMNDLSAATGLRLFRQLAETRDGNLGDGEIHDQLPFVIEAKNQRKVSVWKPWEQAREAAERHGGELVPVAALRKSRGRGRPALRVATLLLEDLLEWVHNYNAVTDGMPYAPYMAHRRGAKPRWEDALAEATEDAGQAARTGAHTLPVGVVRRTGFRELAVVPWDAFCELVGSLYLEAIW